MKTCRHVVLGSGPLGLAVVRELNKRKEPVRLVNQSGLAPVIDTVEVIKANLYDAGRVYDVVRGAEIVYMCAAPRNSEWTKRYSALIHSVISGTQRANCRLVYADSIFIYSPDNGPIREDTTANPLTLKGRIRAKMASGLISAHAAGNLEVVIGRGSDFFGPFVLHSSWGGRVFFPLLMGKTTPATGNIDLPHSYTFIDDFGKALVILGENRSISGNIYHVPNSEALPTRKLLETAFSLAGMPVKIRQTAMWMASIENLFTPRSHEMVESINQYDLPFIVDSSRFTRTFGMIPTPLEPALQQTIDWYRDIPE